MSGTETWLDGNAAAGAFGELLLADFTLARAWCRGCGARRMVGELHAYLDAPGSVLRCPACEQVLMTLVRGRDRCWLEMGGAVSLELPMA